MTSRDRLRQAIDAHRDDLRAGIRSDRETAILAILRARDEIPHAPGTESPCDLVTGRRLTDPGGNMALRICLEATGDVADTSAPSSGATQDGWAERFLGDCGQLAEAELVVAHIDAGILRLAEDGADPFRAWVAVKRTPATWRERADLDWWAAWLARRSGSESRARQTERAAWSDAGPNDPRDDATYRHSAEDHLARMAYQIGYPAGAVLGGRTVQVYRDVVGLLIGWALRAHARGEATAARSEWGLIAEVASALGLDSAIVGGAVTPFTLDQDNAAYHATVPGVAAAPLVRVGPDRLAWSLHGLTTEPLLFLTRELRRRDAEAYHNAAFLREDVFRRDLYALFADKRFVTSPGGVKLRRDGGDVRTDIDAVVFDRKSGTLAFFELKSQDPFARSTAELARQRDNVLYANRQVSGVLTWLKHHGPDALLARIDARTARTFRVQKVYPFVLGRYLAHFNDGPAPDRRAAWGTWPQLLRLLDDQPVRPNDANPIASLFTRLAIDAPGIVPDDIPSRKITIGTE